MLSGIKPSKERDSYYGSKSRVSYYKLYIDLIYIIRKQIYFEIISRTSTVIVKLEKRKRVGSQDVTVRIATKHEARR